MNPFEIPGFDFGDIYNSVEKFYPIGIPKESSLYRKSIEFLNYEKKVVDEVHSKGQ